MRALAARALLALLLTAGYHAIASGAIRLLIGLPVYLAITSTGAAPELKRSI
jgi:hypothetical protein